MSDLLIWSLAFPNISAQRVFVAVYTMLGERVGQLRGVSIESLVVKLDELGLRTERGKFTQRTVNLRLKDLVKAGLAAVEKNPDGTINLTLFQPSDVLNKPAQKTQVKSSIRSAAAPPPVDRLHVTDAAEMEPVTETVTETETETVLENEADAYKEYINININTNQENKQINAQSSETVDSIVSTVDFTAPGVAAVRRYVSKAVYEEGLHADLVDRATAAIVRGYADKKALDAAIRESRDRKRQLETTRGFKGAYHLWETFALKVKSWYDAASIRWTATSFRREKQPEAIVGIDSEEYVERLLAENERIKARLKSGGIPVRTARRNGGELCGC